jgi:ABC-type branched-subunit amino acid transport system substrate-binding protein
VAGEIGDRQDRVADEGLEVTAPRRPTVVNRGKYMMLLARIFGAAAVAALILAPARAADPVKLGTLCPLTGNSAPAGQAARSAIELAVEIANAPKDLQYLPSMIIGDDAGFSDPSFIPAAGDTSQGVLDRSAWDAGKPASVTDRINRMYKAGTGRDLDDTSGRWMQAFFVLADAINRAGATDPAKIQKALQETDLPPQQLMMGYRGVTFDETGQNTLASTYLMQLHGLDYRAVRPAARATAPLAWPMTGWK